MLALTAARLFDGERAAYLPHPVVLVDGGRVVAVHSGGPPPSDAEVVDLGDATLLPGLIDAHMHLVFDASPDPVGRLDTASADELLAGARAAARTALRAGITTVRDLGDRDYLGVRLRGECADDVTAGPEVLAAGPPLTTSRGHCWFLGGEAVGVDGVRAAVRERVARGVDVIKVMATGGELTPGTFSHLAAYEVDELRAAADEAHRHGLPITAHAHGQAGVVAALDAGFDMVEHASFLAEHGVHADDDVIERIARVGIPVGATIGLLPGAPVPPRLEALSDQITLVFQRLMRAGVTVVCSSDAGIGPMKPHDILPYSAQMMVDTLGADRVVALRAVTSVAAAACRIGDRKGRVAPGYDADLVAVGGDPMTDIAALRSIRAVFRQGVRVR